MGIRRSPEQGGISKIRRRARHRKLEISGIPEAEKKAGSERERERERGATKPRKANMQHPARAWTNAGIDRFRQPGSTIAAVGVAAVAQGGVGARWRRRADDGSPSNGLRGSGGPGIKTGLHTESCMPASGIQTMVELFTSAGELETTNFATIIALNRGWEGHAPVKMRADLLFPHKGRGFSSSSKRSDSNLTDTLAAKHKYAHVSMVDFDR